MTTPKSDYLSIKSSPLPLFISPSYSLIPCKTLAPSSNPMAPSTTASRWLRPEVYPLFAATGTAIGICVFQLVRNLLINPDVRVMKKDRAAGVLDNHATGEKYAEHSLRKFVRNRPPEIMPNLNNFFTKPT